jgi:hypothetical protein
MRTPESKTLTCAGRLSGSDINFPIQESLYRISFVRGKTTGGNGHAASRHSDRNDYFAAFLCRSVQTDIAVFGSTALSPSSMCCTIPFLSMTMLARCAH